MPSASSRVCEWRPFRGRKRIRNDSRPLFPGPIGEREAGWPRLQARVCEFRLCKYADQGRFTPLFARPMAEQRVAWPRLQSRFDPHICISAPSPVYKRASLCGTRVVGCGWSSGSCRRSVGWCWCRLVAAAVCGGRSSRRWARLWTRATFVPKATKPASHSPRSTLSINDSTPPSALR